MVSFTHRLENFARLAAPAALSIPHGERASSETQQR